MFKAMSSADIGDWPEGLHAGVLVAPLLGLLLSVVGAERATGQHRLERFERIQLTDVYYSEGANAGDLNGDGEMDVVYGPYWYAGPDFRVSREIYPAKPQPREAYADNFFNWVFDFNGDGWKDVLVVGFPGTAAYVYENPKSAGFDRPWPKHEILDWVSNESPQFVDLIGDTQPELVCTRDGYFGYATFEPGGGLEAWTFHTISERVAPERFGHGLGIGDIDGDGRMDVIVQNGWYQQPEARDTARWRFHAYDFTDRGGAEMYAYDVDGDGDQDVITSLAAHEFGLAWFEQERATQKNGDEEEIQFRRHLIMGDRPDQNQYGVVFSELHSVNLQDLDGDGLRDIVTGKTYWSHHRQSPMWDAGAVVYWFRLVRTPDGVQWIPYQADSEAGIGRQLTVADVNHDQLPDLVLGGMKGAHVLLQRRDDVSRDAWEAAQPKPYEGASASFRRGPESPLDPTTGRVAGAVEAERLQNVRVTSGRTQTQAMQGFSKGRWSGNEQLFWVGGKPGAELTAEIDAPRDGTYQIHAALTMAGDYAIVQLALDGKPLGKPLDLYNYPDVITTGQLDLGQSQLTAGKHQLSVQIQGSNPAAAKAYMFGLDYLQLTPVDEAPADLSSQ